MNYQEFKDYIKENIKDYLPEKYQDATVSIEKVKGNNDIRLDGLFVKMESPEQMVCPTILNDFFQDYKKGKETSTILEEIAEVRAVQNEMEDKQFQDFSNIDKLKRAIVFEVVGTRTNVSRLSGMPHRVENDMAIIYQVLLGKTQAGYSRLQITNETMKELGVNEQMLYDWALKNTPREFPANFYSISEILNMKEMGEDGHSIFVLTNDYHADGAATLFYPNMKEYIAEQLGADYFILPLSIHQYIILRDDGNTDYQELKSIVKAMNQTELKKDEILTEEVYSYDRASKELMFASEKLEKNKELKKEERKPSIMDMLNEKKQEVQSKKPETKPKKSEREM